MSMVRIELYSAKNWIAMRRPKLHPACSIFPALGEEELQELADDIAENGLRNPIILYQGKILDGRNRFEACKRANVQARYVEFDGDAPIAWVVSQNLVRRHLTASQRAVVAFDLLPLLEKEAKQRQRLSNGRANKVAQSCATSAENGKAAKHAARIARSSSRYVEMVKAISITAPALVERIRNGEMSVPEANRHASAPARSRRKPSVPVSSVDAAKIQHGDCLDLIPTLEDTSVHLALTSPPYAEQRKAHYRGVSEEEFPNWTVQWMGALWDKLSDTGSVLLVIRPHLAKGVVSDYVLRTRLALREDGWFENEELIWLKPDAPPLGSTKRPRRTWEQILWFSKSPQPYCDPFACGSSSKRIGFDAPVRFSTGNGKPLYGRQNYEIKNGVARSADVIVAPVGGNTAWGNHPAAFPERLVEQLILTFSQSGDLVLDPFVGSGTTCVVAKKHGRDFRGFDIENKYVKSTRKRLAEC